MTATDVDPALSRVAARAWEMLTRAENPMHVMAALDWCRIESGCEDVRAVKRALYGVAAEDVGARQEKLHGERWRNRLSMTASGCCALEDGDLAGALRGVSWIDEKDAPEFRAFRADMEAALILCREIESQPE